MDFAGAGRLNTRIDSLIHSQIRFLNNYLIEKGLPPERFRIIESTPDSIMPAVRYPSFRFYLRPGE